jgi:UDP:flavonoid glycosyltransferase YjiC (YdhE family)
LIQYHWHPKFKKENLLPHVRPVKILGKTLSRLFTPIISPLILNKQLSLINQFLESHNLAPCKNIYDFYCSGDFRIFPDAASLFDNPTLEKNELFIGPLIWRNKETTWPSHWPKSKSSQKSIYLTMGSTGNHKLVPRLAKALSNENFRLFISTSGSKYHDLPTTNTFTADFVPAESVLEVSDLIICNGGTSTTYHGIANGIPVFAFPTNMDQYLHSHQLKIKGVADYENFNDLDIVRFIEKVFYLVSTTETKSHVIELKNQISKYQTDNPVLSFINKI